MTATRRCGVLGDPIAHSLSPVLHRAAYAAVGLDWAYDAHRVQAGGLEAFLAGLDESWRGLSLTMPLKREAMALVEEATPFARLAGAANTLLLGPVLVGDNTDLPGAVAAIRERVATPLRSAVVLGGGATATSVGLALCELGVTEIEVLVRSPERARETVGRLAAHPCGPSVHLGSLAAPRTTTADIVVSTVPAQAQGPDLVRAHAGAPCVFDVLYDPWPTPLASASDGVVVSGLDLLVHQAALQFRAFTGVEAPLEVMREAGARALAARGGTGPVG